MKWYFYQDHPKITFLFISWFYSNQLNNFSKLTLEGELCEESSVGDDEPVADPCPTSADPSLLDLESAIFLILDH